MKKIAVWKVILLTVVTLGLYAIFWAGRNRDYIEGHYKKVEKIPRWSWLLAIPILGGAAFIVAMIFGVLGFVAVLPVNTAVMYFYVACIAMGVIPLVVGLWWVWYFGGAMRTITQGRISRTTTLFLYVFVGPFVIAFHQYYINRLSENKKGEEYSEGVGLLVLFAFIAIFGLVGLINTVFSAPATYKDIATTMTRAQEGFKRVNSLDAKYKACIERLQKQYPEEYLAPEDEAAYNEGYAKCEVIYKEYEAVFDKYLRSY